MKSIASPRLCRWCNKPLSGMRRAYCTWHCESQYRAQTGREHNNRREISVSKTGAASELVVCVDLLRQGFDVFRAVNPDSRADLVAVHAARTIRIQVRTASLTAGGAIVYTKTGLTTDHCDVLAIVIRGTEVRYVNLNGQAVIDLL